MPKRVTNLPSIAFDIGAEVTKNFLMRMEGVRRWRAGKPRTISATPADDLSLDRKALGCLNTVLGTVGNVRGLNILEIGPGDTLVSGLCFLAAGANSYVAVDRFAGNYTGPVARAWYRKIREVWPTRYPSLQWPEWLDPEQFPDVAGDRLKVHHKPVENQLEIGTFDIVCSQDVGEHVSDSRGFAEASRRYLRPGGMAIHNIDFGPHGPWTQYEDPHIFLYFPNWLYELMNSARGGANRLRLSDFESAFGRAGLHVKTVTMERFTRKPSMAMLPNRQRQLGEPSLMTARAILVCQH